LLVISATIILDELMPRYATMIYNGYWWSPERQMLQTMIDQSQLTVNGKVRLKLYKGNVDVVGRVSDTTLFNFANTSAGECGTPSIATISPLA
jgi:argininosuccinate synthase